MVSWERVPSSDPLALRKAVASQPVVVGISTQGNLKLWDSVCSFFLLRFKCIFFKTAITLNLPEHYL